MRHTPSLRLAPLALWLLAGCAGTSATVSTIGKACDERNPCGNDAICDVSRGVCVAPGTPVCGPSTCPDGCCQGGTCQGGEADAVCGLLGQRCADCTATGQTCAGGRCGGVCTPNCAGKCEGADDGCGGACAGNTCDGCCDGKACLPGTAAAACGTTGIACVDCGAAGQTCAGGVCQAPTCGASCGGCCDGNTCIDPPTASKCGAGGVPCQDCGAGSCNGGGCDDPPPPPPTACGSSNCAGCCNGDSCVTQLNDTYCGKGGVACQSCTSDQICWASDGLCHPRQTTPPPTYTCGPADSECPTAAEYMKSCTGGLCLANDCCCPTARQCRAGSFPVCCDVGKTCKSTATGECG